MGGQDSCCGAVVTDFPAYFIFQLPLNVNGVYGWSTSDKISMIFALT